MWARIRETLADWYILIIAICLIVGGLFAASHQVATPTTTQQSTTQTSPSPTNVAMSQQPQRAPSATPPAPPQPPAQQTPPSSAGSPAASLAAGKDPYRRTDSVLRMANVIDIAIPLSLLLPADK